MKRQQLKRTTTHITLDTALRDLPGIGEKRSALLARLGLQTVSDVLTFYPRKYEDRRNATRIADLCVGQTALVFACVQKIDARRNYAAKAQRTTARLADATGSITAVWFNRRGLDTLLPPGTTALFYGQITEYGGALQISNPEFEVTTSPRTAKMARILPIYPCTEGLAQHLLRSFVEHTLDAVKDEIQETLPQEILKKRALISKKCAILMYHFPADGREWHKARRRLVYDELYTLQRELRLRRLQIQKNKTSTKVNIGATYQTLFNTLPFELTDSQNKAIADILADCGRGAPMYRLLQGDVGSGKSIVAIALAAAACDSGVQTAIMAPTEMLASQLYEQTQALLGAHGVRVAFLKGGQRLSERNGILADIENGTAQIIVGTQALICAGVKFRRLGVVIIDEQHRFGVEQRRALVQQGTSPHVLMMTATPIPRSLAQTLFCDLDISELKDKPPGRQKIQTRLVAASANNMQKLLQFIIDEAAHGGRVYWICPRVNNDQIPNTKVTGLPTEKLGSDGDLETFPHTSSPNAPITPSPPNAPITPSPPNAPITPSPPNAPVGGPVAHSLSSPPNDSVGGPAALRREASGLTTLDSRQKHAGMTELEKHAGMTELEKHAGMTEEEAIGATEIKSPTVTPECSSTVADKAPLRRIRGSSGFNCNPSASADTAIGNWYSVIGNCFALSAKQRYAYLKQKLASLGVGLVHGEMNADEKQQAIETFREGETKLLVGTTVLEVGIDIPQASVIVIEAAQMYGLAQLHQLRGRVGRGARRGVCILLTDADASSAARLQILLDTNDGFKIADADMALRGSGKLAGLEQHGISELRLADLQKDIELVRMSREDAIGASAPALTPSVPARKDTTGSVPLPAHKKNQKMLAK